MKIRRVRRPDLPVLTALRFPAALAILLLHYLSDLGAPVSRVEGLVSGVSFFYVLSGFILFYNYTELTHYGSFWMARFARIWPLHIATLLLAFALLPFNHLLGHAHWQITLPANILLLQSWPPYHGSALSYNGVSWSLSVEGFFYLSFPWLLLAIKRLGPALVLIGTFLLGLAVAVASTIALPGEPGIQAFCPLCRVFEFALGMATCRAWLASRITPTSWTGREIVAGGGVILFALTIHAVFARLGFLGPISPWLATEASAGGFAILLWIYAFQAGAISRALSHPVLVRLGEISFATYMCHQLLLRGMEYHLFHDKLPHSFAIFLCYFAAVLALSYLLFACAETPSRLLIIRLYKAYFGKTPHAAAQA